MRGELPPLDYRRLGDTVVQLATAGHQLICCEGISHDSNKTRPCWGLADGWRELGDTKTVGRYTKELVWLPSFTSSSA